MTSRAEDAERADAGVLGSDPRGPLDRRRLIGLGALGLVGVGAMLTGEASEAFAVNRTATAGSALGARTSTSRTTATPRTVSAQTAKSAASSAGFAVAGDTDETRLHLLARATFGPRPAEADALAKSGIDRWLRAQLSPASISDPTISKVTAAFPLGMLSISRVRSKVPMYSWDAQLQTGPATLGRQVHSTRQLFEIAVDVLGDLLHVAIPSDKVWDSGPDYVVSVLRKYAFGRYADLLAAAMKHPAMLSYLDNVESTRSSVNENLGRELLELHTVGVTAGYTEAEVRSSANILSGRRTDAKGAYRFSPDDHWTGPVSVLGFQHENATASQGQAVGDAYLAYLARHPSTARNVARRFARRFVADAPSSALLDAMVAAYSAADTGIVPMLSAMFRHPDFWASAGQKPRRPLEDLVGTARIMDTRPTADLRSGLTTLYWYLNTLGHAPLGWPAPNGFPDLGAAWLSASGMVGRWNAHRALASGWWKGIAPGTPMDQTLKPTAGETYGSWIDRIGRRTLRRALPTSTRAALLIFLDASETAVVPSWESWKTGHVIALLLDSPLHQYR